VPGKKTTGKSNGDRKGAQAAAPVRRPTWAQIFADLYWLWTANLPPADADRAAWTLLWAGAKHFGLAIDHHGDVTEDAIARAAEVILGTATDRNALDIERTIDAALYGAKQAGAAGFDAIAVLLCVSWKRPVTDAPELARMLANVIEDRGKQGALPKGKYTRAKILQWVTGKRPNSTRAKARRRK